MKIYILTIALVSFIYAGTYDDNYSVSQVNDIEKNDDVLMDGDFKEIVRFNEINYIDGKLSTKSNETIENISKSINEYKNNDEEIIVSIIGHTDSTTDNINEKRVNAQTITKYGYSLDTINSARLSSYYANSVAVILNKKGLEINDMEVEYRKGEDNLYTQGTIKSRKMSNIVMVSIYVLAKKEIVIVTKIEEPKELVILDSDEDTVFDDKDECPNTLKGLTVNEVGCHQFQSLSLNFKINSYKIEENSLGKVEGFYKFLDENKVYNVEIIGHTDSVGSVKNNQILSQNRAKSVEKFLLTNGIEQRRLTTSGLGELSPITTNDTKEGRKLNRRIEVKMELEK